MGKGVLIFVMASSLSLGAMYVASTENELESAQNEADYKEELLARETAQSAYSIVSSKVRRSYESYRGAYTDLSYGKASYDIGAMEAADGSVTIIAVGKYGNHQYEIVGSVSHSAQKVLDALTILAPIGSATIRQNAFISGIDGAVGGSSVHGLLTTNATAYTSFSEESAAITGRGGANDVIQGDPQFSVPTIRTALKNYAGPGASSITGDATWGDGDDVGSPGSPAFVRANGNLILRGSFSGYGALFVEGDFTLEDDAMWNGLVYVAGSESSFRMENSSSITGAVIIDGIDSADELEPEPLDDSDRGLLGGHFDVDVFDHPGSTREIYHEHKYDDKYDVKGVDILNSGCKRKGLCWDQIMGSVSEDVIITTINSSASSGTYEIVAGSVTHTGSSTESLNLTVDPRELTTFTYEFNALCSLAPSKPSDVQDDPDNRNGSLSILVHSAKTDKLLYELSIYHHWKSRDGDNTCAITAPAAEATEWVSANGTNYSGDDGLCISEDDNDNYSDWSERTSMWGNRIRKGSSGKKSDKSSKKSKKSDKSDKKSDKSDKSSKKSKKSKKSKGDWSSWDDSEWANSASWYGDVFWANNGKCAKSNQNDDVPTQPMQFVMQNDANITYNSASLKRLKQMLNAFNMSDGSPVARRVAQTSYKDGEMITTTNDGTREVVEMTGTKLENDTVLKDARALLKD